MNKIQSQSFAPNFGCNDSECKNCTCQQHKIQEQKPDIVEISTTQKAKDAFKKGVNFVKNNRKGIAITAKAAVEGLLTACTILGANQLMSKVSKANTSALAAKLAAIGGVAVGMTELIRSRKAFDKTSQDKQ